MNKWSEQIKWTDRNEQIKWTDRNEQMKITIEMNEMTWNVYPLTIRISEQALKNSWGPQPKQPLGFPFSYPQWFPVL